jgi:hypothetical protein
MKYQIKKNQIIIFEHLIADQQEPENSKSEEESSDPAEY